MVDYLVGLIVDLLKAIFRGVVNCSYLICLCWACIAILLYIAGCKRAGKHVSIALIIYVLLAALGGEMK